MIEPVLISGPDVWMESEATRQLAAVAQLEGCVHAAGMPDLHPGRGFPIGAVVACRDVVHPHLVGGDAGCGARVVVTSVERTSPDRLERRLRAVFEAPVLGDVDPDALFDAVWRSGVRALAELDGIPDDLRWLAARDVAAGAGADDDALGPSGDAAPYRAGFARALGTIGGGNHFAELARVGPVLDREAGAALGLVRDAVVVVAHSGSRGLGAALAETWGIGVLRGSDRDRYRG
ncbi:MAG: RtcB family protein, partial [Kofleriaceae bacterium]